MRTIVLLSLCSALAASARPAFIEIKNLPTTVKGLAGVIEKEKPGDFRKQAIWALEAKLREKGEELTDADAADALVDEVLRRIFEDMAAPTDIYRWDSDDAPRGDVLIRDPVLLLPGRTSTGFSKKYTVRPMGKRIDGAYRNTDCTVKVSVAKSPADWFTHVDTKGWGIAVDPIRTTDGIARIVLRFLSKAGTEPPSARHERPVWVSFWKQGTDGAPWAPLLFDVAASKLQREQETTLVPPGPNEKLTPAMKEHIFAIRVGDLAYFNPNRATVNEHEVKWTSLNGLSGSVVDAKNQGWLDVLRMSEEPLVRAVGVLRVAALGGEVTIDELIEIITKVKQARVQAEALLILNKRLDASAEVLSDEDKTTLIKLGGAGEMKLYNTVARITLGKASKYFRKLESGWDPIVPRK